MVWLVPIWLGLFLVLVGCGLLAARTVRSLGGPTFRAPLTTFQAVWFGYAFALLFLEAYSLVLPIRWPVPVLLAATAVAGFWLERRAVSRRLRAWRARPRWTITVALVSVAIALTVAARAAQPVGWYDTHLYHLQVVKWARTFAAVPGIANLHYRLAYNNSIHLFGALTDTLWKGRASHIAIGFLASVVAIQLVVTTLRPAHQRARVAAAYCLLTLPYVLRRIATNEIASLSSDLPLSLLCIVFILELIGKRGLRPSRSDLSLALVAALASVATTTKLGGLGVLAISFLLVAYTLYAQGGSKQRFWGFATLPALVLLGYLARQTVLSGWLLFPTPIGNLHLPWSLPEAETLDQFRWIQSWARIPKVEPADVLDQGLMRWFDPWFGRFANSQELVVLVLACVVAIYRFAQPKQARLPFHAGALAAASLSLVLWFRGAPDLRFGAGFFWMLLAVLAAPLLAQVMQERVGRLFCLALGLSLMQWTGGLSAELPHAKYWVKLPPIAKKAVQEVELSPGLKVRVPSNDDDRCSNEPLPCTPYPVRQKLRRANDLGHGFIY